MALSRKTKDQLAVLAKGPATKAARTLQCALEAIDEAFTGYVGRARPAPAPRTVRGDLLTIYNVADHHLGMYAWARETGNDYDLEVARDLLLRKMRDLVARTPNSATAVVLNLGDFFHSDSNENRTRKGQNPLDTDTRYAKVLQMGVDLMVQTIELALQKHQKVIVRNIAGNHDTYAALALSVALEAFFRNDRRVVVDADPAPFWWYRFGKVLLGAAHGDMARPEDMPSVMAAVRPEDWGATTWRYVYLGHFHRFGKGGEAGGARWETFQTLAARDAWATQMGFASGRSMTALTHHKEYGLWQTDHIGVQPPERKRKGG